MNRLVSALIGETTTTGAMGAVETPMKFQFKRRFRRKKKVEEGSSDEPIIPPDAQSIEGSDDDDDDDDDKTIPTEMSGLGGLFTDEQLQSLVDLIADRVVTRVEAVLGKLQASAPPEAAPKAEVPSASPEDKPAEPQARASVDPTVAWLLHRNKAQATPPQAEDAPAFDRNQLASRIISEMTGAKKDVEPKVAFPAGPRSGDGVLGANVPMPVHTPSTGKAIFEAFCRLAPVSKS